MDKKHFSSLLEGIRQVDRHIKGKHVPGARVTKVAAIEPRKIRLAAGLSQSEFAQLIGVPLKSLQNGEQNRTKPAGTARALPPPLSQGRGPEISHAILRSLPRSTGEG